MAPTLLLFALKTWFRQTDPVIEAAKEIYRQKEKDDKLLGTWLTQITVYLVIAALVMAGDATGFVIWYYLGCLLGFSMAMDVVWRITVGNKKN
jgi:hypothetical protein